MTIDLLTVIGVANVVGLVFKPVLVDFAREVLKDTAKDYVKGCFGSVFSSLRTEPLQRALGKALRELLQLIQDELLDCGLTEEELEVFIPQVREFTRSDSVQHALQQLFTESASRVDPSLLAQTWERFADGRPLSEGFSWQRIAGRFTRAVRSLREQDAELRDILNAQAVVETARSARQLAGLAPAFDLVAYRLALLERYANLHFQTLDTTGAYYSNVKLWSVFVPQSIRETQDYYPQLLEVPKEHSRRMRERGELDDPEIELEEEIVEERRRAYLDQSPRPVLEVCGDGRIARLVILGDPGSGKSSLLQYLALEWARIEEPNQLYTEPLPLLVELREYDRWQCPSGKSFVRFLHEGQTWHRLNQEDLDRRIRGHGATVLMLDGLDEIFDPARREAVINDVHRFSNDYPGAKLIVTSRVFGYKQQRLADAEFQHFMLQDLDDSQIGDFLGRWHETTFDRPDDREFKKERLVRALRESNSIRELAGNPLLLTMMSILNRNQELPRDRVRLYEQASRVFLHEWDTERALGSDPRLKESIGYAEKAGILREVADYMQHALEGLAGNIIARDDLERILRNYLKDNLGFSDVHGPARALVEQLRERNFILCYLGEDSYAFVHRTFLEYFCASAVVVHFRRKLSMEFLKDEVFGAHWSEETWHEVLCLIVGMIAESSVEQVGEIIEFLLSRRDESYEFLHTFLAARCYQEIRNPSSLTLTRHRLLREIEKLLRFDFPFHYQDAEEPELAERRDRVRVTALVATSRLLAYSDRWLKDRAAKDDDWALREAGVMELARAWKDDPETRSLLEDRAVNDDHWAVRLAALRGLARGWKDDAKTLLWLKSRVEKDDDIDVRQAAVQELAHGWKDDPDTFPWLYDRAATDGSWSVRRAAMQEMARGWPVELDTLRLVKDRAANDKHVAVRSAAVQELARGWRDEADTVPLLKDSATKDDDTEVRHTAVRELASFWKSDPETVTWLKDQAAKGHHWSVRREALQTRARLWKEDPDTVAWLKECATKDDSAPVRHAAAQELVRGWKDDPDTLLLLKDHALNDDNRLVRQSAVWELARGWKDDFDIASLLKACASNDAHSEVRETAVRELARGWKSHPDTVMWLKATAEDNDKRSVTQVAVRELAQGWKDDPDILSWLKNRAASAVSEVVRQAAVRELARGWKEDPFTLRLLQVHCTNDGHAWVRQTALHELARGWRDDPVTLALLKDRIVKDTSPSVREAALQELARGWKNDEDTLLLLKERATDDGAEHVRSAAVDELARRWKYDPDTCKFLAGLEPKNDNKSVDPTGIDDRGR